MEGRTATRTMAAVERPPAGGEGDAAGLGLGLGLGMPRQLTLRGGRGGREGGGEGREGGKGGREEGGRGGGGERGNGLDCWCMLSVRDRKS